MNRSIMYWKWDNDVLDLSVLDKKTDDLLSRTQIGNIFIGTQWIVDRFHGEKLGAAFRRVIERLHAAGRKAMIECCIRNEGEPFYRQYPGEPSYLLSFYECEADEHGAGSFRIPHEPVWHYWRHTGDGGEHKLFACYRLKKTGAFSYSSAVRCDGIAASRAVKAGEGYEIEISFTGAEKGESVAVCVGFPQPIVDLAHPKLLPYFRTMAEHAKELGADGVFSDEWGYDMILKIVKPNPYDDTELNLRHISWSEHFESKCLEYTKRQLFDRLLDLFYTKDGEAERSKEAVDDYLRTLRLLCTENEEGMYETVKEVLGKDAFWGVHPTWWGSVDSLNFEFYKNGFYWWDAKRDYAQTDETILYCIRTALAHRFSSPVWYNMWYSMGTRDINTYYTETWRNLRYGGRTHYLGYECPNEAVVLELKPEGMLESIEEMDARVRLFDGAGAVQPDCRLLLLFGYEAVSNWADIGMTMPWKLQNPRLDAVLNTANAVFSEVLCDLVPSYAAENASLFVNGRGRAQYGTQESMTPSSCSIPTGWRRRRRTSCALCPKTALSSAGAARCKRNCARRARRGGRTSRPQRRSSRSQRGWAFPPTAERAASSCRTAASSSRRRGRNTSKTRSLSTSFGRGSGCASKASTRFGSRRTARAPSIPKGCSRRTEKRFPRR